MKDLSLNVLDVTENSIRAGAKLIELSIEAADNILTITIKDNGCGMSPEMLRTVTDPFTTSRTTRRVGMGLPLFKLAAEQTGGGLAIDSELGKGTMVTARFYTDHIDCPPLGDMASTVAMLAAGLPDGSEMIYKRSKNDRSFVLDTGEIRAILGGDISLGEPEVQLWLTEYLREQENSIV